MKTSEFVTVGHPDKTADYISCYLLDRYIEKDSKTRFALEVQIKDEFVTLGGEITSTANFTEKEIANFVREAVEKIGYTAAYQKVWGAENVISSDKLVITQHISQQSPDIAQGVDASGWGDQGIFWGMATNTPETNYMPADYHLAKKIGQALYDTRCGGLDIKTQVTMKDGKPEEIVVAIPMLYRHSKHDIETLVAFHCNGNKNYNLIINGTGRYVRHSSVGDCGTTGRKLAVDFYGGNCRIGGGSPWTKDGTKADLSLNLLAREKALDYIKAHPEYSEIHCAISCKIGSPEITVALYDQSNNEIESYREEAKPEDVIEHFRLREQRFAEMCMKGLFE